MLTAVEIRGYQSLRTVSLALGLFTVITGPTGSGKSAALRAVRLCVFNARGIAYISRGESVCQVMVGSQGEAWAVSISRHKVSGRDRHRHHPGPDHAVPAHRRDRPQRARRVLPLCGPPGPVQPRPEVGVHGPAARLQRTAARAW